MSAHRTATSRPSAVAFRRQGTARRRTKTSSASAARIGRAAVDYDVHPAVLLASQWVAALPARTGRSLEQWLKLIRAQGPRSQSACWQWLQSRFRLGSRLAWWLADIAGDDSLELARTSPEYYLARAEQYVTRLFAGSRAALRPIHEELVQTARTLGPDVRICPSKTATHIFRRQLIAALAPAGSRRLTLALALGEEPVTARLKAASPTPPCHRLTHEVWLGSLSAVDLQVRRWLKQAYELDA